MRRLVILLLICALPIRIWASEVMALHMASGELQRAVVSSVDPTVMASDCPLHAGEQQAPERTQDCTTCDLCAAIGSVPAVPACLAQAPPQAAVCAAQRPFLSADPLALLRPPRS